VQYSVRDACPPVGVLPSLNHREDYTWANESYQITIAPNVKYCLQVNSTCQYAAQNATFEPEEPRRTVTVKTSYIATHAPTVRSRLLKAGVRLGHVLNGILSPTE
jgi:hypothetical protein